MSEHGSAGPKLILPLATSCLGDTYELRYCSWPLDTFNQGIHLTNDQPNKKADKM